MGFAHFFFVVVGFFFHDLKENEGEEGGGHGVGGRGGAGSRGRHVNVKQQPLQYIKQRVRR